MSYPPHPEIAKQLGVPGNDKCICPEPINAMACPYGHMLECHYPLECEEALCEQFMRSCDFEWYEARGMPIDGVEIETEDDDIGDNEPRCHVCHEFIDECQCDDLDEEPL
jgi:hypothetical protein